MARHARTSSSSTYDAPYGRQAFARPSQGGLAAQDLRKLRASIHLAQEMGTRLGERALLLGALPAPKIHA